MAWARVGAAAVLWTALAGRAFAFGDCEDPQYWRSFDDRIVADSFGCVERLRVEVATEDGPRAIRVVQGFNADWALAPGYAEAVEEGVRAAAAALARLGPFKLGETTVLLIDDLPPGDDRFDAETDILGAAGVKPGDDECRIGMYALARGEVADVALTIAHEIFHCVQYATAGRERVLTLRAGAEGSGPGGDWWVEGSAEWFGDFAVPNDSVAASAMADFDAASARPLHHLSYSAAPFFMWLAQERGPQAVVTLIRGMATSGDAAAQEAAMRGALENEGWLRFAQVYLDRGIRGGSGATIASSPDEGPTWRFETARTERIPLQPFAIVRGTIAVDCGRWAPRATPEGVPHASAPFESGSWGPLPDEIDGRDPGASAQRFVAIATDAAQERLELAVERRASCTPCAGSEAVDACIVGVWRKTGGGAAEALRGRLPPGVSMPRYEESEVLVVYRSDGSFVTAPLAYAATFLTERRDGTTRADGRAQVQASGRWSAADGAMAQCTEHQALAGVVDVTRPGGGGGRMTLPPPRPTGPVRYSYTCAGDVLELRMDIPGFGPMSWTLTREAAAP